MDFLDKADNFKIGDISSQRIPRDVLEDHLKKRKQGRLEEDLAENYSEDVVLLTCSGIYHGHEGIRRTAQNLKEHFSGTNFDYHNILVVGELGFVEWSGYSKKGDIKDGADSYLIRGGKIVAQTIHYRVEPKEKS